MERKNCKIPMCLKKVWRTGNFSYSDYCFDHDPDVKRIMQLAQPHNKEKGQE